MKPVPIDNSAELMTRLKELVDNRQYKWDQPAYVKICHRLGGSEFHPVSSIRLGIDGGIEIICDE